MGGWINKYIDTVRCYAVGAQEFICGYNQLIGWGLDIIFAEHFYIRLRDSQLFHVKERRKR